MYLYSSKDCNDLISLTKIEPLYNHIIPPQSSQYPTDHLRFQQPPKGWGQISKILLSTRLFDRPVGRFSQVGRALAADAAHSHHRAGQPLNSSSDDPSTGGFCLIMIYQSVTDRQSENIIKNFTLQLQNDEQSKITQLSSHYLPCKQPLRSCGPFVSYRQYSFGKNVFDTITRSRKFASGHFPKIGTGIISQ